ncbi:Hypothetical_protein [Hexamita inflata]|uniref:Hypothetical_protein n=1 Tax=Hexamita inflata TaxID=28002 RepID=A0AA86USV1_9EUKA|nr:Hypothetical protein HINF_LOCUS51061 [Hexamita inflata]
MSQAANFQQPTFQLNVQYSNLVTARSNKVLYKILIFRTRKITLEFQSIYKLLQTLLIERTEHSWGEWTILSTSPNLNVIGVEVNPIPSLIIVKASLSPSPRNLCNLRRRKSSRKISEFYIIKTPTNIIYQNQLNYSHTTFDYSGHENILQFQILDHIILEYRLIKPISPVKPLQLLTFSYFQRLLHKNTLKYSQNMLKIAGF